MAAGRLGGGALMRSALRGSVAGMRTRSLFLLAASALVAATAGAQAPTGGRLTIDQLIHIKNATAPP